MTQVRRRITRRVSGARLKLALRRSVRPLFVYGGGLLVAGWCAVYILNHLPGGGSITGGGTTVRFVVSDAAGVVPQRAELRFKGVPAGIITDVEATSDGAVLVGRLDPGFGRVYRDARAALRPNTPLQDMYVDILERGTPRAGETSERVPLPRSRTTTAVKVADVLQTFDGDTRARLTATLTELGQGLDDRGDELRRTFVEVAPFLDVARRITREIAARKSTTTRLIANATVLTDELGRRERDIRRLIADGGRLVGSLRAESPGLDGTLAELPRALTRLQSSFGAVRAVLPDVDGAVRALDPVTRRLGGALRTVERLNASARPAVRALEQPVARLRPLAATLPPVSEDLRDAVTRFEPNVPILDRVTTTVAKCGYTIERFFQWTASVFAMGDGRGVAPRGDAAIGLDSPGLFASPFVTESVTCAGGRARNGLQELVKP